MRIACRRSTRGAADAAGNAPDSLSFELLARRPDLQALRGYVSASMSQVDAAKAAFYPHFDIKAFWGYNALSVGDLFKSSSSRSTCCPGCICRCSTAGAER
jgi:outer membrane protein TolC